MTALIDAGPPLLNATATNAPMGGMIHPLMKKLRKAVGGLKAERQKASPGERTVPFAIKSAKVLMNKFRKACDAYDINCYPVHTQMVLVPRDKGAYVAAVYTIRFVAIKDLSYVDVVCTSEGADTQDKAAGKAMTYGWKFAVIYSLLLPDGDVKEEWDDVPDTDDDYEPTLEPDGIAAPVLSDYVRRACETQSLDEFTGIVTEMRATFTASQLRSQSAILVEKREQLLKASAVAEEAELAE